MKDTMRSSETAAAQRVSSRKPGKQTFKRCSICNHRTWFNAIPQMEPEGAPEPHRSWILCQPCNQALLIELQRSPISTPLRLRIAMGLVAAERSPRARARSSPGSLSDRAWILVIAWGFVIAMILHLVLIVLLAFVAR